MAGFIPQRDLELMMESKTRLVFHKEADGREVAFNLGRVATMSCTMVKGSEPGGAEAPEEGVEVRWDFGHTQIVKGMLAVKLWKSFKAGAVDVAALCIDSTPAAEVAPPPSIEPDPRPAADATTAMIVRATVTKPVVAGSFTCPSSSGRARITFGNRDALTPLSDPVPVWNHFPLSSPIPPGTSIMLAKVGDAWWILSAACTPDTPPQEQASPADAPKPATNGEVASIAAPYKAGAARESPGEKWNRVARELGFDVVALDGTLYFRFKNGIVLKSDVLAIRREEGALAVALREPDHRQFTKLEPLG